MRTGLRTIASLVATDRLGGTAAVAPGRRAGAMHPWTSTSGRWGRAIRRGGRRERS
jgi:hypothetical protein